MEITSLETPLLSPKFWISIFEIEMEMFWKLFEPDGQLAFLVKSDRHLGVDDVPRISLREVIILLLGQHPWIICRFGRERRLGYLNELH